MGMERMRPKPLQEREKRKETYADVCDSSNQSFERGRESSRVEVQTRGPTLCNSWWSAAALCHSSSSSPDWGWVKQKIEGVFDQVDMKQTEEGDMLVFLRSEEDRNRLISMPPLSNWEGSFSFRAWNPSMGSLHFNEESILNVEVAFGGIPYHLRVKSVIESLAMKCGGNYVVENPVAQYKEGHCFALLKGCAVGSIPRILKLVEKRVVYTIWVEVLGDQMKCLAKKATPQSVEEVSSQVRRRRELNQDDVAWASQRGQNHVGSQTSLSKPPGFEQAAGIDQLLKKSTCQVEQCMVGEGSQTGAQLGQSSKSPVLISPNRFESLQVEVFDPRDQSPILISSDGFGMGRCDELDAVHRVHNQVDEEPLQALTPVEENRRGRSITRRPNRGLGLLGNPIGRNKLLWKVMQNRRHSRERIRDTRDRSRVERNDKGSTSEGEVNTKQPDRPPVTILRRATSEIAPEQLRVEESNDKSDEVESRRRLAENMFSDNLTHRGSQVSSRCSLCDNLNESITHLLLHCSVSLNVWSVLTMPYPEVYPNLFTVVSVEEWLKLWTSGTQQEFGSKVWSYLPYAVFWTLWKTRNHRIFRQKTVDVEAICREVKFTIWYWCSSWKRRKKYRYQDLDDKWSDVLTGLIHPL
ncbi:hypothetical protein FRX31_031506 [Thalictrum thalictroides]|uniref:Reverse transcriptase zinc-binding domain-containing protein n=1 Tax=Thalictrum thalictroides TaxID=46969 RepID=A0A7J6V267_THATH|nr:hypothetical protein FRX31_031506 [Thalictrum thalictroides]